MKKDSEMGQLYARNSDDTIGELWTQRERIGGIQYAASIATKWSDADLAAIGLFRLNEAEPVPAGKQIVGSEIVFNGTCFQRQNALEDIPAPSPLDYPLNPAQFDAILALLGITVEQIDAAIDTAINDPTHNAFAKAKVRKATAYRRENDLFALLGPIIGITDAQIDTAWMQAKDLH